MTDAETWARLAQHWDDNHCAARPGVPASAITEFEQKYQVVMPADVRSYFLAMDGQCAQMGDDLFRFWPLSEVRPASEGLSDDDPDRLALLGYFLFADYLISSWEYAVRMQGSPDAGGSVYCVAGGERDRQVAVSFTGFIGAYVNDPMSVAV